MHVQSSCELPTKGGITGRMYAVLYMWCSRPVARPRVHGGETTNNYLDHKPAHRSCARCPRMKQLLGGNYCCCRATRNLRVQ